MATAVPKRVLVPGIIRVIPEALIRTHLNISHTTPLENRLHDFTKSELERLIRSTPDGEQHLASLEERYPLESSRTFYLPKIQQRAYTSELRPYVNELADAGREEALLFDGDKPVRAVYVDRPATVLQEWNLLEIPLVYERKIEYRVADPEADNYGDPVVEYGLERAVMWLVDDYSHCVICCSGLAAVRAIVRFAERRLDLTLWLPSLTAEMYSQLTQGGEPRSTTFTGFPADVPTVTVHAPALADTELFRELEGDPERQQTSGFFRGSDNSIFFSFGVSRRYARMWTPWQYSKTYLVHAMTQIIARTEEELSAEYEDNLSGYASYHEDAPVTIGTRRLTGGDRRAFQQLFWAIVDATRRDRRELEIAPQLLQELVLRKKRLQLSVVSHFDCTNCGGGLGRCPDCWIPYEVRYETDVLHIACPNCRREINEEVGVTCECGTVSEIAAMQQHLQLYPEIPLLDAVARFAELMDEVTWQGLFTIDGYVLRVLEGRLHRPAELPERVGLHDLRNWRMRARHHERLGSRTQDHLSILKMTKEKCARDGRPPTKTLCADCLASTISVEQIRQERELCLPRILGLAIHEKFDGIHHGYEIADVKYEDTLDEMGRRVRIGIHLKSRKRPKPQGLGRGTSVMKALYAQVFYSAYKTLRGDEDFDIIGISVPNTIHPEVQNSLQELLNRMGFGFLVLDEEDWLRIMDSVLEQLQFNSSAAG